MSCQIRRNASELLAAVRRGFVRGWRDPWRPKGAPSDLDTWGTMSKHAKEIGNMLNQLRLGPTADSAVNAKRAAALHALERYCDIPPGPPRDDYEVIIWLAATLFPAAAQWCKENRYALRMLVDAHGAEIEFGSLDGAAFWLEGQVSR